MSFHQLCPESLKQMRPYLLRAKEVENVNPLVAYYTHVYVLKRCIRERDLDDHEAAAFIKELLAECEKNRPQAGEDIENHKFIVENFPRSIFEREDQAFREGRVSRSSIMAFLAVQYFIDICGQFGELSEELVQVRKDARFYAGLINKAFRDGTEPVHPAIAKQKQLEKEQKLSDIPHEKDDVAAPSVKGSGYFEPGKTEHAYDAGRESEVHRSAEIPKYSSAAERPSASEHHAPAASPALEHDAEDYPQISGTAGLPNFTYPERAPSYPTSEEPSPLPSYSSSSDLKDRDVNNSSFISRDQRNTPNMGPLQSSSTPDSQLNALAKELRSDSDHKVQRMPPQKQTIFQPSPADDRANNASAHSHTLPSRTVLYNQQPMPCTISNAYETTTQSTDTPIPPPPATIPAASRPKRVPDLKTISLAQKKAKFAISALDFQDVRTAIAELEEALNLLRD